MLFLLNIVLFIQILVVGCQFAAFMSEHCMNIGLDADFIQSILQLTYLFLLLFKCFSGNAYC